jgi:hypothetical protein
LTDTNPTSPLPGGREHLAQLLGEIAETIAAGDHDRARQTLFRGRWVPDVDLADVPEAVLALAIQHTDAAHAALSRWPPDIPGTQSQLVAARRALVEPQE